MEIKQKQPTVKGPAETFTGDVWIDGIAQGEEPSRVRVNTVRLSPGALGVLERSPFGAESNALASCLELVASRGGFSFGRSTFVL